MSKFGTWAVVPVKSFATSKSRLADLWDSNDRAALSAAMLRDVLGALCAVSDLAGISVVSAEPKVARIAQEFGAEAIHDTAEIGPSVAVAAVARSLAHQGARTMLAVMGDVPLINAQDVVQILDCANGDASMAFVPARDGIGCNAALISPPDLMPLTFDGRSLARLRALAGSHVEIAHVLDLPDVALDIDDWTDVVEFFCRKGPPSHTRAFVEAVFPGSAEFGLAS